MTDVLDTMSVHQSSWFTLMDMRSTYSQVNMHSNSIEKTTFVTKRKEYRSKTMTFGFQGVLALCNDLCRCSQRNLVRKCSGVFWRHPGVLKGFSNPLTWPKDGVRQSEQCQSEAASVEMQLGYAKVKLDWILLVSWILITWPKENGSHKHLPNTKNPERNVMFHRPGLYTIYTIYTIDASYGDLQKLLLRSVPFWTRMYRSSEVLLVKKHF